MTRRLRNGPEFPKLQSGGQLPFALGPELVRVGLRDPGKTSWGKGTEGWVERSGMSLTSVQRISAPKKRTLPSILLRDSESSSLQMD